MLRHAAHPGTVLKDELDALGITPTELARQIGVPANRVCQIVQGKRAVTGDTALRLGHWFENSPQFWMNLQAQHDLVTAEKSVGALIKALPTKPVTAAASKYRPPRCF